MDKYNNSFSFNFQVTLLLLAIEMQETVARANNASKQKLLIETNSIQRTNVELDSVGGNSSRALKRVFLSNRNIKCNDGSQAGFYLRKSAGSRKWVVFLEGGWHCYDQKSCRTRWLKLRHLMTSASWPEVRDSKFSFVFSLSS
jgi:O-palmitoleoyl-L-serine hydrolase